MARELKIGESLLLWGPISPPIGGVSTSLDRLQKVLAGYAIPVYRVDLRRMHTLRNAAHIVRRNVHGLVNLSHGRRLAMATNLARTARHPVTLYIHGTAFLKSLERSAISVKVLGERLAQFHEVWTTNQFLLDSLPISPDRGRVVSAYIPDRRERPSRPGADREHQVVIAVYRGKSEYGLTEAVKSVELVRQHGPPMELTVFAYGDPEGDYREVARQIGDRKWVTLRTDVSSAEIAQVLDCRPLLLRPTTTDGDSILVREALSAGCRVVASDAVPRPAGVELASRSPEDLASAILKGSDRVSSGAGLGVPLDAALLKPVSPD